MKTKNLIGLDSENAQQVVNLLNELLANYQIYYQNLRGFHWNVRGNRFFVLHAKFEELYNDAIEKVDEIAERILTLGGVPLHSYAAYTKVATLKAKENVTDGDACLRAVVEAYKIFGRNICALLLLNIRCFLISLFLRWIMLLMEILYHILLLKSILL